MSRYHLGNYESSKQQVVTQLIELETIAKGLNLSRIEKEIQELSLRLQEEQFEIIVVGEFSNGKSTFVNALLGGYDVLPSSVKPTTAILNKLYYHETPIFSLHFRDKKRKRLDVPEDMFQKIIAPSEPVDNQENEVALYNKSVELIQSIKFAEIGYPAEICKNNMVIIDSPGTNDLDPAREAITYEYIPKSDAAIILLHAKRPLAESEMSFIKDRILSADIHKIFFVVNFKDQLRSQEEIDQVYQYIKKGLEEVIKQPKVFFVSSKHALSNRKLARGEEVKKTRRPLLPMEETGFIAFEEELMDFLQYDRGYIKIEKPVIRGKKLAKEMIEKNIQFERMSLNNNIANLHEQTNQLKQQLGYTKAVSQQVSRKIQSRLQQAGLNLKNEYERELMEIAYQADRIVDSTYYKGCDIDHVKTRIETHTAPLERSLHEELEEKMKSTISSVIKEENRILEKEMESYTNQLQSLFVNKEALSSTGAVFLGNHHFYNYSYEHILERIFSMSFSSGNLLGLMIAGMAAMGYYAMKIIEGIFDFFTGRDRKLEQLKGEVTNRYRKPIAGKVKQFNENWTKLTSEVPVHYLEVINEQIVESENQLAILLKNNKMSELEIQEKLRELEHKENKINQIALALDDHLVKLEKLGVVL